MVQGLAPQSPRPDLHRDLLFTKQLLGLLELQGQLVPERVPVARAKDFAPAEGFEPSSFPVTVGHLTVRLR